MIYAGSAEPCESIMPMLVRLHAVRDTRRRTRTENLQFSADDLALRTMQCINGEIVANYGGGLMENKGIRRAKTRGTVRRVSAAATCAAAAASLCLTLMPEAAFADAADPLSSPPTVSLLYPRCPPWLQWLCGEGF